MIERGVLINENFFIDDYQKSQVVIFGAPFDGTVSYRPGTRFAPSAIRTELFGIEPFSPYQDRDISEIKVFDHGDLDIPFGNTNKVLDIIENFTDSLLEDDKLPLMIGGEHLTTLGVVRSLSKKYSNLRVIHFDAHADLLDEYIGEKLSHATVMRRIWELVGDNRMYQFGIRSGKRHEFEFAKEHIHIRKFDFMGLDKTVESLAEVPVYLSIDLDVLDTSVLPGTGTPEAGGVTFNELLDAILLVSRLHIVGCDMVELSPIYDQSGVSTAVACKVLRELLLAITQ